MAKMPNPQRVPVVDPATGLMTREWVRYLSELQSEVATGGTGGGDTIVNNNVTNVYQLDEESPPSSAPVARVAMLERRVRVVTP